jgi:hypothetical protein
MELLPFEEVTTFDGVEMRFACPLYKQPFVVF